MPFAFIKFLRRAPGTPDNSLPEGSGGEIDNSLPGEQPGIDNELPGGFPPLGSQLPIPPLVGVWPKPGRPNLPVALPPIYYPPAGIALPPIYIQPEPPDQSLPAPPNRPSNELPGPPGTVWPPLQPGLLPEGKVALLVKVLGVPGLHWVIVDQPPVINPAPPPQGQPKRP